MSSSIESSNDYGMTVRCRAPGKHLAKPIRDNTAFASISRVLFRFKLSALKLNRNKS